MYLDTLVITVYYMLLSGKNKNSPNQKQGIRV